MPGLWFLLSARHLKLIDILRKFREDSLTDFKVKSGHHFVTESKGKNSKSINARVMQMIFLHSACHLMLIDFYTKIA